MIMKLGIIFIALAIVQVSLATPYRLRRQADPSTTTTPSPRYRACFDGCQTTPEYNPVCGTDGVTYQNMAKLRCAVRCGQNTALSFQGTCQAL